MDTIEIRRLTPDDWPIERDLRLAALTDAPFAFGSTLAETVTYVEADWRERMGRQVRFAALVGDRPAGTAGWSRARSPYPSGEVLFVGMWVAPPTRGRGVGDALVRAVLADAAEVGSATMRLAVTPGNEPAVRLYARHGFIAVPPAGRIEPDMIEMVRRLPERWPGEDPSAAV